MSALGCRHMQLMSALPPKATLNASIRMSASSLVWDSALYRPHEQRSATLLPGKSASSRGASMKVATAFLASIISAALPAAAATAADAPPQWAYPANNPNYKPPVDDGRPVRVPDSTAGYTWSQLRDRFIAPIWHPGDHRPLPNIVASGPSPTSSRAATVIVPTGPAVPKTRTSPACRRATLFNRWRTIRVARAEPLSPVARHPP